MCYSLLYDIDAINRQVTVEMSKNATVSRNNTYKTSQYCVCI